MTLRDESQPASSPLPKPTGRDERLREIGFLRQALRRPELGAAAAERHAEEPISDDTDADYAEETAMLSD